MRKLFRIFLAKFMGYLLGTIFLTAGAAFAQAAAPAESSMQDNSKERVVNFLRKLFQAAKDEVLFDETKTQELLGLEIKGWRSYKNQGSQVHVAEGVRIKSLPEFDYKYGNVIRLSISNNTASDTQSAIGNFAAIVQVACIDKQEVEAITGGQGRQLSLTRFHRSPRYGGEYRLETPLRNGRLLSTYTNYELAEDRGLNDGGVLEYRLCLSSLNVAINRPLITTD